MCELHQGPEIRIGKVKLALGLDDGKRDISECHCRAISTMRHAAFLLPLEFLPVGITAHRRGKRGVHPPNGSAIGDRALCRGRPGRRSDDRARRTLASPRQLSLYPLNTKHAHLVAHGLGLLFERLCGRRIFFPAPP